MWSHEKLTRTLRHRTPYFRATVPVPPRCRGRFDRRSEQPRNAGSETQTTTQYTPRDTRSATSRNNQRRGNNGNDPELDTLLLRLHTETACRRGGALALRPCDLDADQSLILLHEKGDTTRWQPVSPTLMRHLLMHAETRGAEPNEQLLRYRNGQPITARRLGRTPLRLRRRPRLRRTQQQRQRRRHRHLHTRRPPRSHRRTRRPHPRTPL